jgi:hypothetical protein
MKKFFPNKGMIILFAALLVLVTGCSQSQSTPASAVEAYHLALVARDKERVTNLSCADWEATAQVELTSLTAVEVTLEDMSCQESGQGENFTLVNCSGKIVANYGNEVLELDLSERSYQVVEEGGEWRMCGYR